jgi:hypothetical protein
LIWREKNEVVSLLCCDCSLLIHDHLYHALSQMRKLVWLLLKFDKITFRSRRSMFAPTATDKSIELLFAMAMIGTYTGA